MSNKYYKKEDIDKIFEKVGRDNSYYRQICNLETHTIQEPEFNVGDIFYYPYQGFVREGKVTKIILGIITIDDNSTVYKTKEEAEQALKENK